MRMAIMLNQSDEKQVELSKQAIPLLKNPHVLARMLETNRHILCPHWLELYRGRLERWFYSYGICEKIV